MDERSNNNHIDDLKRIIGELENHINSTVVGSALDNLYNELLAKQQELYKLGLDRETKKSCNYDILKIKKALQLYYNELLYLLRRRYNDVTKKISSISNSEEKAKYDASLSDIKMPNYCAGRICNPQDKLSMSFETLSNITKKISSLEKEVKIIPVKTGNLKFNYINDIEIDDIEKEIAEYNNGNPQITKEIIILGIGLVKNKIKKLTDNYKDNAEVINKCSEALKRLDSILNEMNSKKDTTELENNEEVYHVEKVEDGKHFYKRHNKKILLALGVASLSLANSSIGVVLIPSLIFANIHMNKAEIMERVNAILGKAINATKLKDNNFIKNNGLKIDAKETINSLLKGVAVIKNKSRNTTIDLLDKVKKLSIVINTKERLNKKDDAPEVIEEGKQNGR